MTDDISKVVREMRDSCNTVGCGGRHGYCDLHLWADRLESATTEKSVAMRYLEEKQADTMKQFHENYTESATTPAEVDAPGIDTANHAGVRVRGYTVEQYATLARQLAKSERDCAELRALLTAQNAAIARADDLARQLAEAKADNERLRVEVGDWNVNGPALVQQLELSKQREAHFTTQMLEARNAQQQAESQLAEATRRLGEVEGLLRECQRRLGAEESLRHMTYREWSELDDRIDAALTKEPTK